MPDDTFASPLRALFICTHNSSRSQMAEALLRAHGGGRYAVYSAGTHARGVHLLAIAAKRELGFDLSPAAGYLAKSLHEFEGQPFDLVVTVCDQAAEECPYFARTARQEQWSFPTQVPRWARRSSGWRSSGRCAMPLPVA